VKGLSKKQLLGIIEKQSAQLKKCEEQIETLKAALEAERIENELLRQKVSLLVRRLYGPSSEKLSAAQPDFWQMMEMIDEDMPSGKAEASSWNEEAAPQPRRRAPLREQRWPENLPVVEEVIDPAEVKEAPEQWRCIGQEVSERLDYEPARFLRRRLIRRKYVSRKESQAAPIVAGLPPVLQERSLPAAGLLAQIIVSKYCDHVPLYRQEQIYWTRHRVWLPRQNQARWMGMAADWFKPIYEAIRTGVMAGGYVQVDETPVHYLCPGHGKTKIGYFWTASRPGGDVVYQWQTSRGAACLDKVLPVDFKGTVQCDAYPAYASFARRKEHLQLAGCWAHTRRKFYEARDQDPRRAGWLLRQIGHLYDIERELREHRAGPQLRAAVRTHRSRPIVARLHPILSRWKLTRRYLPRSGMGLAIDYALSNWKLLGVYLEDGRIQIDQNLVENAIRPTALGKRNWLFIGEAEAGERSAILYTIVECCRRRDIDPYAYLRDILTRLPSSTNWQIADLTPEAWARPLEHLRHAA
jgi:transposase